MSNGIPTCNICGASKEWREPGYKRDTGEPYEGFWGCPNYKNHPPKQARPQGRPQPNGQQSPPAPRRKPDEPNPAFDSRERSIAAQACCKAACEAAGVSGLADKDAQDWIVRLANRLFREVVWVAIHTQNPGVLRPAPPVAPPAPEPPPDYQPDYGDVPPEEAAWPPRQ